MEGECKQYRNLYMGAASGGIWMQTRQRYQLVNYKQHAENGGLVGKKPE